MGGGGNPNSDEAPICYWEQNTPHAHQYCPSEHYSLIHVVLCKMRSLSRVGRYIYWSLLKSNTDRSFLQIYLSLTGGHVYLCPRCGLCSVSADREQEDGAALSLFCVSSVKCSCSL